MSFKSSGNDLQAVSDSCLPSLTGSASDCMSRTAWVAHCCGFDNSSLRVFGICGACLISIARTLLTVRRRNVNHQRRSLLSSAECVHCSRFELSAIMMTIRPSCMNARDFPFFSFICHLPAKRDMFILAIHYVETLVSWETYHHTLSDHMLILPA